jgi:hypothetical protein
MINPDWLGRDDLLALDIEPVTADAILARWGLRGHGGRLCIEAERLDDYLGLLEWEQGGEP